MRGKFVVNSILGNKGRSLVIIFCLAVSVGMVTTSWGMVSQLAGAFEHMQRVYSGNSDIILSVPDRESVPGDSHITSPLEYMAYSQGVMAEHAGAPKLLRILDREDIARTGIIVADDSTELSGGEVLVPHKYLNDKELEVGEPITLVIGGEETSLVVGGTFESPNQYLTDSYDDYLFTTFAAFQGENIDRGIISSEVLIKVREKDNIDNMYRLLAGMYGTENVRLSFDEEEFRGKYDGVFTMLFLVSISIGIMGACIVYSTKKFVLLLDAGQFAIIRSVGGNRRYVRSLLLLDAVIYGIAGGVVGIGLSKLLSLALLRLLLGEYAGPGVAIRPLGVFLSIALSVAILYFVNILASRGIRRRNIRAILKDEVEQRHRKTRKTWIPWTAVLLVNIAVMILFSDRLQTNMVVLFILTSIVCCIGILPHLVGLAVRSLALPVKRALGNVGYLSIENIKASHGFVTNVILVTVSISLVLLINSAIHSTIENSIGLIEDNFTFDFIIPGNISEEQFEMIQSIEGIEDGYLHSDMNNVLIHGTDSSIYTVEFVTEGFDSYRYFEIPDELYRELYDNDKKVILSNTLLRKLELGEGDTLQLIIFDSVVEFEVVGSLDTTLNNGDYAMASYSQINFHSDAYFNVGEAYDTGTVIDIIRDTVFGGSRVIYSRGEYIDRMLSSSSRIFNSIRYLSILPVIVSLVISLTNGIFSFYEGVRNFVVLRTLGMRKKGTKRVYRTEQYIGSILGCALGVLFGNLLIEQVKTFMHYNNNTMAIRQSLPISMAALILPVVFCGIVIKLISGRLFELDFISELRK